MPCQDETSFFCMPCQTVKQCALALCLCVSVSLFLYTVSEERTEADTQRVSVGVFTVLAFLSAVSFWSRGTPSTHSYEFKDEHLLT